MSPVIWIKQHILKLSSEFGVDFKGCKEKAEESFMKIGKNKQESKREKNAITGVKKKRINELKGLVLDTKFMSFGSASRGEYLDIEQG